MTSAGLAVTLSLWRGAHPVAAGCFGLITLVFMYTTLVNIIERPDGVKIGAFFIAAIILSSLVSRVWRTTELRVEKITLDSEAQRAALDERKNVP
jgi:predicted tellurium resistance membrane protein TerC